MEGFESKSDWRADSALLAHAMTFFSATLPHDMTRALSLSIGTRTQRETSRGRMGHERHKTAGATRQHITHPWRATRSALGERAAQRRGSAESGTALMRPSRAGESECRTTPRAVKPGRPAAATARPARRARRANRGTGGAAAAAEPRLQHLKKSARALGRRPTRRGAKRRLLRASGG